LNKNDYILNAVIAECEKHLKRMDSAYTKLSPSLPIKPETVNSLSDDEVEHIDQFIYRFSKLQDAIGKKLFTTLLSVLGEDTDNKSLLDIFNRLEQLEIIEDYDTWKELRDIRNELVHEYEEDAVKNSEMLNLLLDGKFKLAKYFDDIIKYVNEKKKNNNQ